MVPEKEIENDRSRHDRDACNAHVKPDTFFFEIFRDACCSIKSERTSSRQHYRVNTIHDMAGTQGIDLTRASCAPAHVDTSDSAVFT